VRGGDQGALTTRYGWTGSAFDYPMRFNSSTKGQAMVRGREWCMELLANMPLAESELRDAVFEY